MDEQLPRMSELLEEDRLRRLNYFLIAFNKKYYELSITALCFLAETLNSEMGPGFFANDYIVEGGYVKSESLSELIGILMYRACKSDLPNPFDWQEGKRPKPLELTVGFYLSRLLNSLVRTEALAFALFTSFANKD